MYTCMSAKSSPVTWPVTDVGQTEGQAMEDLNVNR